MIHTWFSPAKINLFLYITGQRSDGYHFLQTLFQFLNYGDIIKIITTNNNNICLKNKIPGVPKKNNLIIRAAQLLQNYCRSKNKSIKLGADIYIKKILPIGGGLGGGSSNAATILLALNNQWQCKLDTKTLSQLGLKIGADIPIFIYGKSAFAENIGEKFIHINPKEKWYLILVPPVNVNTSFIFNNPELKRNSPLRSLDQLMKIPFSNDCEPVVRKNFNIIEEYFLWLSKYTSSRLTGTGSCIFSEFNSKKDALHILSKAPKWINGFVAKGTNISPFYYSL